jgi:hemerythrin superfamily protein
MDITQLIIDDHAEQRRLFALIEQMPPDDTAKLAAVWKHLAAFLETHAEAEEKFFYPALLKRGKGADDKDDAAEETEDAIEDHNKIRDAVAATHGLKVGSAAWFEAVAKANHANSDHMGEEERQGLTDFRINAPLKVRHDLAVEFIAFEAAHITGVKAVDKDPEAYIAKNS